MPFYQYVYVQNESTVIPQAELADTLTAVRPAIVEDFKRHWNVGCTLRLLAPGAKPPSGNSWVIHILDDATQAGALGYHDVTGGDIPVGYVFAKTDLDYGYDWVVTFTHELFEMLADPRVNRAEQTSSTRFYALEVCDPCERDSLAYTRKTATGRDVLISDFITERWFNRYDSGPYDFAGHLTKPLQVLSGCHAVYWENGGWHGINNQGVTIPLEADELVRNVRYRRSPMSLASAA